MQKTLKRCFFFFSRTEEIMQVNSLNQRIGKISRKSITKDTYFRTCAIFLHDDSKKIVIQKRAANVVPFPLFWDTSAGGVVRINETDLEAIFREVKEEIGVVPTHVTKLQTISIENEGWFWWCSFFKGRLSGDIVKSAEVEEYQNMSIEEIHKRIKQGEKFTPTCLKALEMINH